MTDLKSEAYSIWRRLSDPNTPLTQESAVGYLELKLKERRQMSTSCDCTMCVAGKSAESLETLAKAFAQMQSACIELTRQLREKELEILACKRKIEILEAERKLKCD